MAVRNKSTFIPNEIYFITFTISNWHKVFVNDKYCRLIYKWFDYSRNKYGNKVHGYVIMPNHIHVLMYINNKSPEISVLIQNAKRFIAYAVPDLLKEDGKLDLLNKFKIEPNKSMAKHRIFEPRYDSLIIQTQKMFLQKLNYIHDNPCQAKWLLAGNPEGYKYSSAVNYTGGNGCYEIDLVDF